MTTTIKIRPAARGGKFLGHDAADSNSNSAIAAIFNIDTLDVVDAVFVNAPLTSDPGPAGLMFPISRNEPFDTDSNTVNAILNVDIDVPTTFLIFVGGPLSFIDQARISIAAITILPGVNIGDDADFPEGLVLEIPGLCISAVQAILSGRQLSAFATVTMMCGCKISDGTAPPPIYWPPADFNIELVTKTASKAIYSYPLTFDMSTSTPSSFSGSWPNQAPGDNIVEAWISASEPKLGNQGYYTILPAGLSENQNVLMKKAADFLKQDKK